MTDSPAAAPSPASSRCAVCTNAHTEPYVQKDGYSFNQCPKCGYIFCHPRPSQAELADFYAGFGGDEGIRADYYPKASSRKRRGFLNALRLFNRVWNKRALDLGCGGGFVVGGMKALGARTAVGVDINPNAIDYARNHFPKCDFHCGTFDDFTGGALGQFDFVYSSEVIEHVEDVEGYMRFLAEVTAPGGTVFITTPDIGCDQVPADVTAWDVFSPPMHIQFFTQATLARLFDRFGFTMIKRIPDPGGAGLKMLFRKSA